MDAREAETFAEWFGCLADPTRLLILNVLAEQREPMMVGQILAHVGVAQSTVSHHLKRLAASGFVEVERRGTASWYRINVRCISALPSAADVVMGSRASDPSRVPAAGSDPRR